MDNVSIKDNIRKVRKARKVTQEEMADKLGMSITAYRDFERGNTSILNNNLIKISALLETPAEELVLGYRPSQIEGANLNEIHAEYSGKIDILKTRVADLEKLVRSLEGNLESKDEIILMLKKKLGEDK